MIELTDLRSKNSKHFLTGILPDGALQMQAVIGGDISHYKDNNGVWQDIDFSLSESAPAPFTHQFTKGHYSVLINANTGKLRIYPDRQDNSKYIVIGTVNNTAVNVQVIDKHLVRISKNTPDVTYNFFLTDKGIKTNIVLKNSNAPSSYNFEFKLSGGLTRQGREIYDGNKIVGTLPNPFLYDSSADPEYRGVAESFENGAVTLTVNLSGLTYPVIIDPTLTVQPSTNDSTMKKGTPTTNYGTNISLQIAGDAGGTLYERTIINFNFASLPSGIIIVSAAMSLYRYGYFNSDAVGRTYTALRCTRTNWTEGGVAWDTYDGTNNWTASGGDYTTTDYNQETVPAIGNWMDFSSLKAQVDYAINNTSEIIHIIIAEDTESAGDYTSQFYSNDYTTDTALRPKLIINYNYAIVLTELINLSDDISKLAGKDLSDSITLTDLANFLITITENETLTLTDAISTALNKFKILTEALTLSETIALLTKRTLADGVTLSDAISAYAFKPNKPLASYSTKLLIDMFLDSGTRLFSGDDIYINE